MEGPAAVAFLSRAEQVSKGQLRRIWDVADHRKTGSLDETQFFIALRLVALAQRGAELSVQGLRNFTGIQLIPKIALPPEPTPPPEVPEDTAESLSEPLHPAFSWIVTPDSVARYDAFFETLHDPATGLIAGMRAVTFFGKSGLPRATLKRIWSLADVTRDGKLSLSEFRVAVHMVTSVRTGCLDVATLPDSLDPEGPNWLQIAEEPASDLPDGSVPTQQSAPVRGPGFHAPSTSSSDSLASPRQSELQQPEIVPLPHAQGQVPHTVSAQTLPTPLQQDAEKMLDALRKERVEMERARKEMAELKAEMMKLRVEQESRSLGSISPSHLQSQNVGNVSSVGVGTGASPLTLPNAAVEEKVAMTALSDEKKLDAKGPLSAGLAIDSSISTHPSAPTIPVMPQREILYGKTSVGISSLATGDNSVLPGSENVNVDAKGESSELRANEPRTPPQNMRSGVGGRDKPIDLGLNDDDIWDQPSPKSSKMLGGETLANKSDIAQSDSVSSDDDFWGGAGMGTKPSLGAPGRASGGGSQPSKGFGGSELDDWVF